jgi:hypothetical protein
MYIKPQLDRLLGHVSAVHRTKNEAARQKLQREARELAASPERLKLAIEDEMRARLQANQYLLMGIWILVMAFGVQPVTKPAIHDLATNVSLALLLLSNIYLIYAFSLAHSVMREAPRLREARRVSDSGDGLHRQ